MIVKKILAAAGLAAGLLGFTGITHAAMVKTDIIMIVDESGSMGGVQANLRNNIGLFASILSAGNVDAQYGLVGYGNNLVVPRMLTDLTDPASFATAAQGLVISGSIEPAFTATAFALNALDNQTSLFSFRPDALKNIIIFTDEPSNGDTAARGTVNGAAVTYLTVDQLLTDNNALFNAVLSGTTTINSIGGLALGHSGQVFNLQDFNTTNQTQIEAFVTTFANAKLQEIIDFCTANPTAPGCQGGGSRPVPAPGTLALLGLGLTGLGMLRRRRLLA